MPLPHAQSVPACPLSPLSPSLCKQSKMSGSKELKIAAFPWLAFGHLIPFLELSKLIAQKGHKIFFISTPRNIQRLPKIPPNLAQSINFVSLPLPSIENLPPDAEATTDLPSEKIPYLKTAFDGLQESVSEFLETLTPDWILCDFAHHRLPSIAAKLGISLAFFNIISPWSLSFLGSSSLAMINGDDPRTEPEHFTVPPSWVPFPSKIAFRLHEAKQFLGHSEPDSSGFSGRFRAGSVIEGSDVIAIRSSIEIEADYLKLVGELHGKPVIPVGILPPDISTGGHDDDERWITITEWLDKQKKGAVVYVAFGSEVNLSQDELTELALGLELSGLPFFWVLRKQAESPEGDRSVELPDGFEERVSGRGVVWGSWAPQCKIMAHESVGGFLTHCGYASVLEALYFGLPLAMLPFNIIDQGLVARFFGEKNVGIEIPRDEEDGSFTRNSIAESLRLVVVDEQGEVYRNNAKQMSKLFADKDVNDKYIDQFVEFLQNH